ncbi:YcgN family cysteine cluster protein [Salinibius halmophilus]|uniref:YcgN family cysteine cluster protein n=1 Tax=Salinibius halmophilus TaxID=1853216 RepID=UPI000E66921D|nr:YcgN family cysteine cluster protein [Salinibius halmophilus]
MRSEFWTLPLSELDQQEWEALCDGCALCCLQKLEDDETNEVWYTGVVCRYLDSKCHCKVYDQRHEKVPNCVQLTQARIDEFHWLPQTCAYRLRAEDKPLPSWHPLLAGSRKKMVRKGQDVWAVAEVTDDMVPEEDWQDWLIFKA